MLCDDCKKNEASFHSVSKINGVTTEKHLCTECQKKYGGFSSFFETKAKSYTGLNNLFSGLVGLGLSEEPVGDDCLVCPTCGTSADVFLNSGFVGCSDCYQVLSSVVLPVIQKMQGERAHIGKVPVGQQGSANTEYERLKKELDEAIAVENYEQASIIRDRMRQLKGDI